MEFDQYNYIIIPHLCYEGDGGVGPDLLLNPHVGRFKLQDEGEVSGIVLIIHGTAYNISSFFIFLQRVLHDLLSGAYTDLVGARNSTPSLLHDLLLG